MADVVEIEGPITGYRSEVAKNNALRVIPGVVGAVTTKFTVTTGGDTLLPAKTGRVTATIQNLDDTNAVHIHLGTSTATTGDLRLDPGLMYTLPAAYEGQVSAIAVTANVEVVAIEYVIE